VTRLRAIMAAALVGVLILAVGVAYVGVRTPSYQSTASLVFVPKTTVLNEIANLTGSYSDSGTAGTYVEFIASKDTVEAARATGVSVAARAVPDSRVVNVATEGTQSAVQPALRRMLAVIESRQAQLNDAWALQVLQGAQPPAKSGASTKMLLVAVLLLAALGALLAFTVLTRLFGVAAEPPPALAPREAQPEEHEDAQLTGAPHTW
jgi:hypothetical protein